MVDHTMQPSSRATPSGVALAAALIAGMLALGAFKEILIYAPDGADADLDARPAAVTRMNVI
jgi:hypothetical protein